MYKRQTLRALGEELGQHFPQLTDQTELVLMEISPHQLHAYWHITPWDLQSISHLPDAKNSQLILRFHDFSAAGLASAPPPSFDVEINDASGSQYIEVWEDARRYGAELGLLTPNGVLLDLARSNTIELPRAGHAISPGTQVLTLTPLADNLYRDAADMEAGPAPPAAETSPRRQAHEEQPQDRTLLGTFAGLPRVFPNPCLMPEGDLTLAGPSAGFEATQQTPRAIAHPEDWQASGMHGPLPLSPQGPDDTLVSRGGHTAVPSHSGGDHAGAALDTSAPPQVAQVNPRYAGAVPSQPAPEHPEPLSSHSRQAESSAKPPAKRRERD